MTAKRNPQRDEPRGQRAQPALWREVVANPPQRRRWLLIASAAGVLLWTLFLAWMAWQS
jgi:hypothetical protein